MIFGDRASFYGCGFYGVQDTLWDVEGRHYFKNCFIQDAVDDFKFGAEAGADQPTFLKLLWIIYFIYVLLFCIFNLNQIFY